MTVHSWRAVAALFSLLLTLGLDAAGQARPSLIAPRVGGTVTQNAPGAALARKRPVEVDFSLLSSVRDSLQLRPGVAQQMEIPFFEDRTLTINLERMERIGRGVTNFYGTVEGDPLGQAVVTQSRGNVGVTVFTQGMAYQVRLDGEGSYVAQEVNRGNLAEGPNDMPLPPFQPGGGDSTDSRPPVASDDGSLIDVMVIYTTRARQGAGSVAAIESEIDNAIAITNSGYVNSGATQRVRLVHSEELAYAADIATLNIQAALGDIQANAAIAAKRTQYGADIVSFWVEGSSGGSQNGGCGIGYYMSSLSSTFAPFAYNVLIRDLCAVSNQSFPHELGHNMGLAHDAYVNSGALLYPYGQGYVNLSARIRTIMAYNNQCAATAPGTSCTRINYFSTPTHNFGGSVIGNAGTADSARTLDNTRVVVSNFKASVAMNGSVEMRLASQAVSEAAGTVQLAVARLAGAVGAISVQYATSNGTAAAGSHYTATNGTLNWADGDTADQFISVPILQDALRNGSRTFTVTLSTPTGGAVLGAPLATTVTIQDDEPDEINFAAASYNVAEGALSNVLVLVQRAGSGVGTAGVTWTTSNNSAVAGQDFGTLGDANQRSGTLNWANGDMAAKTISVGIASSLVPIINDTTLEGLESFGITLSAPVGNVVIGAAGSTQVNISDNDKGLAFSPATYEVTEGTNPSVTIPVQRLGSPSGIVTATWTTVNGTAAAGVKFGSNNNPAPRTGTLSWASGDAANKNIVIPILNNNIGGEGDQAFTVTLTPSAGYTVAAPGMATVTIHDDDLPPTSQLRFTQPKYVVSESGGSVTLSVERMNIAPQNVAATARYSTVAGTAAATTDYTTKSGTLSWAAGETGTRDITINIVNNTVAELPEAFRVVLSNLSSGTVLGETPEATVTILDDDELWPPAGQMPPGFQYCSCATTGWHVSADAGAYQGLYSLKANEIEDNQTASVEMTGTFAAGNVNFRVKVSSEATFDHLRFYIDEVLQAPQWSGTANTAWQLSPSYALSAGPHVLRWIYVKDASGSVGMDTVYIDGLVTPAFTPAP